MKTTFTKKVIAIMLLLGSVFSFGQGSSYWQPVNSVSNKTQLAQKNNHYPENKKLYSLNLTELKNTLMQAPLRGSYQGVSNLVIFFPNAEGVLERFAIEEAPVLDEALSIAYPDLKSYSGRGIDNPAASIRFSLSNLKGLSSLELSPNQSSVVIEPYSVDNTKYIVFSRASRHFSTGSFDCLTIDSNPSLDTSNLTGRDANDQKLRTFKLAISTTGGYTTYFGGTVAGALAGINATMTRVNAVFEKEFAITMTVISADNVIYTDASSDPYSTMGNWNSELQNTLTANVGEANYDIGHLFGGSGGGGNAGCIGCVCVDGQKGSGYTSPADGIPEGDNFDIDYVAHEMGHQFGGNHTHSHSGSEGTGAQVEPGSGSTIMGYAGITGPTTDVQPHSDDYFSYFNIQQITNYVAGTTCQVETSFSNQPPTADAGNDYTIPKGTAFVLRGAGSDPDAGDMLTYCWEQADVAVNFGVTPNETNASGPNFRSLPPVTSPNRYMPNITSVFAGDLSPYWESVTDVARTFNFALTVRDNAAAYGQNSIDQMVVTVDGTAGPFIVTSQNTATSWYAGTTQTITWDVAGTNVAPVNTANVNILLTTDDGATFTTILANTPNDGSQDITVPIINTTNGRIVVEAAGNIFYAVGAGRVSIEVVEFVMNFTSSTQDTCSPTDAVYTFTYNTYLGYTGNTTFSATGNPAGTTVTFNPTNASADGTTVTMTVSGITDAIQGAHTITVLGTGTPTTVTQQSDVTLDVYTGALVASTLASPADATTGVMSPYTLSWNADSNAVNYLVEIASDAAFTTIVDSATVTGTTYDPLNLQVNTDYWWRVTASNNCGAAPASTVWTFKTANITCSNVYNAADVPVAISTGAGATYTSTLTVTGGDFAITDVNVNLDITHSWDSDLTITLTSPAGTSVLLTDGNGGSSDNYTNTVFDDAAGTAITAGTAPFTGTFTPQGNLSDFNGENLLGDWILTIVDGASGDGGSLNSWSIDICGSPIPGFGFTVATSAMEVCEPNDAVYNFIYNTYAGFSEVTTFTATGNPAGTTVTFAPATATTDGTAVTMTVSGLTNVNIGNYNMIATGTATGGMVKTQDLTLKVNSPTFAALTLVSPANGLIGAVPPYTLTWNADANADSYIVEVATDAAFTTIIDTATVTTTTYDPAGIVDEMEYFWRVSPTNACGTGTPSAAWSFTTNLIECGTRSVTYNAGDMPVGPDSGTVTTSTLELFDALITDVNVTLTIEHTWMSDLDVFLISPAGTRVELTTGNGSFNSGYVNTTFDDEATIAITAGAYPFTGLYQPEGVLTDFNGENSLGTWTLEITDTFNGDGGNLLNWSLDICGVRAPAFEMTFIDTNLEVCDQADVDYTFAYDTFGGFAEETTFSATGLPAGTTATFSPATATTTGTVVTMTISGLTTDNIGTHTITATGTATGGMVFNQDLILKWNSATFNDVTLLTPPNGAVNLLGTVDFTWEADASGNADEYVFELSDVADFSNIVETVTVTGTSYTSTAVAMNTHYFWRVLPSNGCGTATSGTVFEFTTNDPTCGSFDATGLPVSVGPNNGDTTTSTIEITGAPYDDPAMGIIDINVNLDIDHTWDSDLQLILTSPAGTQVMLSDQHGGSGDNYTGTTFDDQATTPIMSGTAPFTGSFTPDQPLSNFGAESALGIWTLTIIDNANGDGGQLNSWSLDICVAVPDQDFDGIVDPDDNCVTTYNPDQIDRDEDGIGDICDDFIDLQIVVPQGFTPNGDGTNDTWVILHLNQFPNNQTTVYNRWGNEVFAKRGYNNDWDGTGENGKLLPAGSYYYIVDTFDPDGGKQEGWVYINY